MSKKKYSSKKKKYILNEARKTLKHGSGFMLSLFINLFMFFCLVKAFTWSFNLGYGIFGKVAYHPGSEEYVTVSIPADTTTLEVGKALEKAGIIESRWVFFARVRVKGLQKNMLTGKFTLSPSMTYEQILDIICPEVKPGEANDKVNKDAENEGGGNSNEGAGTGYVDPNATEITTEEPEDGEEGQERTEIEVDWGDDDAGEGGEDSGDGGEGEADYE